jgi:hypothetical protein
MDYTSWLLITQASKMNAAGVEAFAFGFHELAIHHLNSALVTINKLLLIHCDQYDLATRLNNSCHNRFVQTSRFAINRPGCPPRDDIPVRPTVQEIKSLQDDRFYIYNQALLFTAPATPQGPCDDDDEDDEEFGGSFGFDSYFANTSFRRVRSRYIQVSFFWSIIHFNMALVLHNLIHETPQNNSRYREEAILFYKLCLQNLWVIPANSVTMNLLMLCAVNNLAHVYLNTHTCHGIGVGLSDTNPLEAPLCPAAKPPQMILSLLPPDFHLCSQTELIQSLLLRAIGKVIANDRSLSEEQHEQVAEMSVNHIVISALSPCYVAAGA